MTILKDYIRPLIEQNICPNLPLFIDGYFCPSCKFQKDKDQECIITLVELADGDLHVWLSRKRTDEELYNALFQIIVAIHAIHTHHQIINLDVKSQNILYKNVKPGGHWVYVVNGVEYFVPNLGFVMILNDFGVSQSVDPKLTDINKIPFTTVRDYMIINNTISPFEPTVYWYNKKKNDANVLPYVNWFDVKYADGMPAVESKDLKFKKRSCYNTIEKRYVKDCAIRFTDEQLNELKRLNIPADSNSIEFYKHPSIIPPFLFTSDLQDCLRMFTGQKRVVLKAYHFDYKLSLTFVNNIKKYINKYMVNTNVSSYQFTDPSLYTTDYFIKKFFKDDCDYTVKLKSKLIDKYIVSSM